MADQVEESDELSEEDFNRIASECSTKTANMLVSIANKSGTHATIAVISGIAAALVDTLWENRRDRDSGLAELQETWNKLGQGFIKQIGEQDFPHPEPGETVQ